MKINTRSLNSERLVFSGIMFSPFLSIVLGSFFIAILAQITIPIPFSPVPITGQTIGVVINVLDNLVKKIGFIQLQLKQKLNNGLLKASFIDTSYDISQFTLQEPEMFDDESDSESDSDSSESSSDSDEE